MPNKEHDISGYSQEIQDKIIEKQMKDKRKQEDFRKGRTLLAIGMALIMFGGPIGIVAGLFLVFYSISFDSANLGFGCVAIVIVLLMLIGAFFTMLL